MRVKFLSAAIFLVAMSGSALAQQAAPSPPAAPAVDVVTLKDGTTMAGVIETITDQFLNVRTIVDMGGGRTASAKRQFAMAQVQYIDFAPLPGEEEAVKSPDTFTEEELAELWAQRRMHLHRPNSNAGRLGLAVAEAYLKSDSDYDRERALGLFAVLEERAWREETRNEAREGRLRALIVLRRLDEALAEARKLAAASEDSKMLIEARYVLARVDLEKLKVLLDENPKWQEDDIVRPDVEKLFHSTVDQFLFPYLFHGTEEAASARGLMNAAVVYGLFEKTELARACAEDVVALYPATTYASQAEKLLGSGQ